MFCGKCGTQNEDGARFCSNCGASLDAGSPIEMNYNSTESSSSSGDSGDLGTTSSDYSYSSEDKSYKAVPENDPMEAKRAEKEARRAERESRKAEKRAAKEKKKADEKANRRNMNFNAPDGLNYKPIGAWGYLGWRILFNIPVVGLILLIIFSAGVGKNVNLRNYARSHLLYIVIILIVCIVLGIILVASGYNFNIGPDGFSVGGSVGGYTGPSVKLQ